MGKINRLEENVFNMIAAGEVVERPSSVVKELVENAIDAGATSIDILLNDGGARKIQVSDNGIGIAADDIRAAFLPHATSKIKNIDDLDTISTLGFRGEALPSIASISEVTLVSSTDGSGTAQKIVLVGGTIKSTSIDSRAKGTTITVENLFFNTPARIKFLKKTSSEQHSVVDVVKGLALANPGIQITLANEDEILLSSEGGTLQNATYSVYGAEIADKLYAVEYTSKSGISVRGYSSSVNLSKPNRTYQTIIVNGRCITDNLISTAADKAYADYFMKRNFPVFALDIVMPFDDVDVNVHPSKTEVRFRDSREVFSAVYHAIKKAINDNTYSAAAKLIDGGKSDSVDNSASVDGGDFNSNGHNYASNADNKIDTSNAYNQNNASSFNNPNDTSNSYKQNHNSSSNLGQYVQPRIDTSALFTPKSAPKDYVGSELFNMQKANNASSTNASLNDGQPSYFDTLIQNEHSAFSPKPAYSNEVNSTSYCKETPYIGGSVLDIFKKNNSKQSENISDIYKDFDENGANVFDGNIVGQIFDTYILVERDNVLYLIDQHAAHERILYDKIVDNFDVGYEQTLLIPYKFKLSETEAEYFDKLMPALNKIGFRVEFKFGNYLMYAMPAAICKIDFKKFLSEILGNMLDAENLTVIEILKDSICKQACKAAIKGGEKFTREQLEYVIANFIDAKGNLPAKCPHGRPAVVTFSKRDVEKLFKRVL